MDKKKGKKPLDPGMIEIDPSHVYFTFSRIRPFFSCGRPIQQTLDQLLKGEIQPSDLPSISLLFDGTNYFSLNNRRLFVFKTLKSAGLIQTVIARVKPVPQTKRMKDKYTVEKCALTAKLMREGESKGEDENNDEDEMSEEEEKKGGAKGKKATSKEIKQTNAGKQAKQNKYEDNENADDSFEKGSSSKKNKKGKKGHTVSITKQEEEKKTVAKQEVAVTQSKKTSVFANFNNDSDEEKENNEA